MAAAFKPNGTPPAFDLDEYKDSFKLWEKRWEIFMTLSTIDTALEEPRRPLYKACTLLSCLSSATLQPVLTMGLSPAEMNDHTEIIKYLKERCNAGRNRHLWRQIFTGKRQLKGQVADD